MNRQALIIDTDCGSDDAVAIAMALNDHAYQVLFLTICSGNVSAQQAATNTLTTIERAGSYEPPVYLGVGQPLVRPPVYAHETHGKDGMGDIGLLPDRLSVAPGNGVFKMLEALDQAPEGSIELVALGPLTNLAAAIRLAPETMRRAKRLSIMGSAGLGIGNVSPAAEFNIWQDPEAAKIVLESGLNLMLVGWDACLGDAMLMPDDIDQLRKSGPLGAFAIDSNRVLMEMNEERFGYPCLDMADPAAMAATLHPACIAVCDSYFCEVDTSHDISAGAVLVDVYGFSGQPANAAVCSKLKADVFKDYLFRVLGATRT